MTEIKNQRELSLMREGGRLLAKIMSRAKKEVLPGKTTKELNELVEKMIFEVGGRPSFKGYQGFPAALCVSLNEEIVHGVPSEKIIKEGDIVSLDIGLFYKGFHTDLAITVPVGLVESEKRRIVKATWQALEKGIKKVQPGKAFGDLGNAIQQVAQKQGLAIVAGLCGHGIGRKLHENPWVLNTGTKGTGLKFKKGMVFCIEPMFSAGTSETETMANSFTIKTKDGSLSAHFEHTVAVTDEGCEVLTRE